MKLKRIAIFILEKIGKMSRRRLVSDAGEESSEKNETVSPPKMSRSQNNKTSLIDRFCKNRKKGTLSKFTGGDDGVNAEGGNAKLVDKDELGIEAASVDGLVGSSSSKDHDLQDEIDSKPEVGSLLSDAQRAKIERNRQKALLLKQARLAKMPTVPTESSESGGGGFFGAKVKEKMTRILDSGGGFLIEEEEGGEEDDEPKDVVKKVPGAILQDHLPDTDVSKLMCEECQKPFADSYLFNHFDCNVCDGCQDNEEKHRLITKTDAKNEYLLKDEDLDIREPPLKYILKKNPHNSRWGDMKLFLHCQIRARAMEVFGSEEALEDRHDQRDESRQKMRQKKFDKKVKELRKKVRSSLFTKKLGGHEHEFGEDEEYDSDKDEYSKKCKTCSHVLTYEKM